MERGIQTRYAIVALAVACNVVSYLDRACISVAAPAIRAEFRLSPTQMGSVFSIFSLAYFLFLTPWGMAADRFGARGLVTIAVFWWSAFTAITGAAWNLASLLVIRFVFGAVEAAISPATASAFRRWVPVEERSTVFGVFLGGGRVGAALAPALALFFLLRWGWRGMFFAFAGCGIVPGIAWWLGYRDPLAAATAQLQPGNWTRLLARPQTLCLMLMAFTYTLMWQFFITWFPTYLVEQLHLTLAEAARYAGLPFMIGLCATWAGGFLADLLSRRFGVRIGRGGLGFAALMLAALFLNAGTRQAQPATAAILMAFAGGLGDLSLGAAWAWAVDIGGPSAGAVSGLMNAASNCGAFVSPVFLAMAFQAWHDWNFVLTLAALSSAISAFLWLGVSVFGRPAPVVVRSGDV